MIIKVFYTCLRHKSLKNVPFRQKSTCRRIEKLLIANRGEIACRVVRTAKRMGVKTVAVYSDVDSNSLHVSMADEAYHIGAAPSASSYLRGEFILETAKRAGCQAIHPGYGFLSENVEFAELCQKNGIVFIGPPPSAIRDMGIKSTSKAIMSNAGVPIIGGYHGENQNLEKLKQEANKIGFPIMIKAVRGGGGKGMRIALKETNFEEALESARTEAQKSFGDSVVLLEKFVEEPRHVEVQVFADSHGNAVHLFERDCSVQRRHQKIIEEAPAPGLSSELRNELGSAAVRAAKAVGYVGAGTVEFILDKTTHNFHFMEMNTRLQVEHPITEMVTGKDLVEWQINIASGEKLPVTQDDITLNGHAFEARIYAENPGDNFMPGAGTVEYLNAPIGDSDVRVETGIRQGDEVSVYYDPMIAKLVVWGPNRREALAKLHEKLLEYNISGLETNVNFLLTLSNHPEFVSGNVHTNFIRDNQSTLMKEENVDDTLKIQAALTLLLFEKKLEKDCAGRKQDTYNPFVVESNFRINYSHEKDIKLKLKEKDIVIKIRFNQNNQYEFSLNNGITWVNVMGQLEFLENKCSLNSTIGDVKSKVNIFRNGHSITIFNERGKTTFELPKPKYLTAEEENLSTSNVVTSPMPGILDKILVKQGDLVKKGDPVFVLISMKMELVVRALKDAKVEEIFFNVGDNVLKDVTVVKYVETDTE